MSKKLKSNENKNDDFNKNPNYWGINPKFWSTPNVFIKDIFLMNHFINETELYYNFYDIPISKVRILGVVIAKDINSKFISYTVDDGSESIECLIFKNDIKENEITNYTKYQIFDTLCIEGKIHEYKNIKNLHIIKIRKEDDINCETYFWLEIIKQRREIKKEIILSNIEKKEIKNFYDKEKKTPNKKDDGLTQQMQYIDNINNNGKKGKTICSSNLKDEIDLKVKLEEHIYDNKLFNFSFKEIKQNKELRDLAIEIIQQ
eukprot:jgi/Orpsp1_1/1189840/evm.model.d7180000074866.1